MGRRTLPGVILLTWVLAVAGMMPAGGTVQHVPAQGAQGASATTGQEPEAALDAAADATLQATTVGPTTSRLAGTDRYASAVAISRYVFADPSRVRSVYLARGDVFADALTAGTLSDGPVLLIKGSCASIPSVVLAEIARVTPDRVVALGGQAAVCDAQLAQAAGGRPTARLEGVDRFETAATIAHEAFPAGPTTVYLANGAITPDAVVAGTLRDGPVLLVSRDGRTVPSATLAAITSLDPDRVVALGGTLSVTDAALVSAAQGRATARVGGSDRYATARLVADRAFPARTSRVYLARGDGENFVDALSAGMLTDGPVLITSGPCDRVRSAPAAELRQRVPDRVVALGGTVALCDSTLVGASLAGRGAVNCAVTACVALTFDDGPAAPTPTLLNTLRTNRVPATFFVVGQMVDARPATTRRTHVEGHVVANHTWDHQQLTLLTWAQQKWEVDVTDDEINQAGVPDTTIMRPPYGSFDANTRALGFPLIMWDVDPRDWEGWSAATVRQRVVDAVRPGSIVLQHDLHANSVAAVPGIIADLHARGYTLVTVPELVPGMDPGDVVYNRTNVRTSSVPASPTDVIVLDDGRELGPVVDEAGIPGLAPALTDE
ncbi:cell wall-binding repeat-containing protein [Ornithinimicrobium sp. W1679]|uniref:cell wall-binding repeat-containing protein n=1 Tax=Ornithinimicrobium sp. W1679 TaxID=3418770 RepID=UPI003CED2CEA